MIMSTEFQLFPFPNPAKVSEKEEPPKPTEQDRSTIAMVNRGYRDFWFRRGLQPPPVSSCHIMTPDELS
jgi:hypothetical protein